MPQLGLITRLYQNNLRAPPGKTLPWWHYLISLLTFFGAAGVWATTTAATLDHLDLFSGGFASADDEAEAYAIYVLAWLQTGYILVAGTDFVWMHLVSSSYEHNEYSPWCSTVKVCPAVAASPRAFSCSLMCRLAQDVGYATLDISCKAGLALVSYLRASRA